MTAQAPVRPKRSVADALRRADRRRLLLWMAIVVPLAVLGAGVGGRLHRTEPIVPSTAGARANALNERFFGRSQGLMVLLEGPPRSLQAEGPAIVRRVAHIPHVHVLDPWSRPIRALRPAPSRALLLVSVAAPFETASDHTAPQLRASLRAAVRPPLAAHVTGYPDVANAIHSSTVSAIERAELIAAPALLLVLLLVLGSPVAAALPILLGGCVVGAGAGVLDLVNRVTPLDATAFNLCTMMGLALGVDYSLLIVTRFRAELAEGASVTEAVARAERHAGGTVRFAAIALALTMIGALVAVPGNILRSGAVGTLVAVSLSVLGASVALPPLLRLIGHNINRAQLFTPGAQSGRWGALALRTLARPAVAGGAVLVLMLAVSAPALSLRTGPPSPLVLPPSSAARHDYEAIDRAVGGGGVSPYTITVAATGGRPLDARGIAGLQRTIERDPRTRFTVGPDRRGAKAAQLLVVPRGGGSEPSRAYGRSLERLGAALAHRTGATVAVGGPGKTLTDLAVATKQNRPLLLVLLLALTYVALVPILRSLVVPLIAVALNALSVAAAFGVVALAFGPSPPLGGPGFVDGLGVDVILAVVLALSIDYEIFLLHRVREGFDLTGTVDGALEFGLQRTAGVITGAAAIMIAVFAAFAISPVVNMRQLGLALAVAVALDATLVRLVLLPAALRLAGPRVWSLPAFIPAGFRASGGETAPASSAGTRARRSKSGASRAGGSRR